MSNRNSTETQPKLYRNFTETQPRLYRNSTETQPKPYREIVGGVLDLCRTCVGGLSFPSLPLADALDDLEQHRPKQKKRNHTENPDDD